MVAVGGRVSWEADVPLHRMLQEMSSRYQPWCKPAGRGQDSDGLVCTLTPCSPPRPAHPSLGVHPCRDVGVQGCRGAGVSGCRGAGMSG